MPLGGCLLFLLNPTLFHSLSHPIFQLRRGCWLSSGQPWPGFSVFSRPLSVLQQQGRSGCVAAPHRRSLFAICCIVCLNPRRLSPHAARSCFPLPRARRAPAFVPARFARPLQGQGSGIPFVAAARAGSGRQRANPPSLFQPHSPCWEPKGFKYLTSDVQKGRSFQKVDAHPHPDPRANLQC